MSFVVWEWEFVRGCYIKRMKNKSVEGNSERWVGWQEELFDCVRIGEEIDYSRETWIKSSQREITMGVHSATGLVLPGTSRAPPIHTTRPILSFNVLGSKRAVCASVVSGPRMMYVILLGG